MAKYLKLYWKYIFIGFALALVASLAFLSWRVGSFVGETTGGGRTGGFLEPSPSLGPSPTAGLSLVTPVRPTPTLSQPAVAPVQKIKRGEAITILLAGYGGNNHAGQWLTDTILLLRYDPQTKTVMQLNIPRDLYVYIPYGGKDNGRWGKINTVLASIMEWDKPNQDSLDRRYRWTDNLKKFDSGINLLADTVETVVGFRVDYWAALSFEGFRRFVDAMGGVEVQVERYFIDHKYPRNDNDRLDASYKTIEFYPGWQRLSGERAIEYARSRYSTSPAEEGDFARSKRQMNLVGAVRTQALKENLIIKSLDYMQALQGKIRFSLDFSEMVGLANYFNSAEGKNRLNEVKFDSRILNAKFLQDKIVDNAYILVPLEGPGKYAAIQRWLHFAMLGAAARQDPFRLQVLNGNGQPGIASQYTDFLLDQGFNMVQEQDGENRPDTVVFDYTMGQASSTLSRLKTYLPDLKVLPLQRPKNVPPEVALQLCLGKDFKATVPTGKDQARPKSNG